MQVQSLGQEGPLEEGTAPHSSILPWRMPWRGEPGGLQSTGSHRAGHDWATDTFGLVLTQPSGAGTVICARCTRENRALIENVPTLSHGARAHRSTQAQGPLCPQPPVCPLLLACPWGPLQVTLCSSTSDDYLYG